MAYNLLIHPLKRSLAHLITHSIIHSLTHYWENYIVQISLWKSVHNWLRYTLVFMAICAWFSKIWNFIIVHLKINSFESEPELHYNCLTNRNHTNGLLNQRIILNSSFSQWKCTSSCIPASYDNQWIEAGIKWICINFLWQFMLVWSWVTLCCIK